MVYRIGGKALGSGIIALLLVGACATNARKAEELESRRTPLVYSELPPFPASVGHVDGTDFHFEQQLAPGVVHRFESTSTGPLTINTVIAELSRPDLRLEAEKGQRRIDGRESIPAMAARLATLGERPLVGINADFWMGMSVPVNMFVDEGMIWKAPWMDVTGTRQRAVFGFDENMNTFIGPPQWTANIVLENGTRLRIDEVNYQKDETRTIVNTWPVGHPPPVPDGFRSFVVRLDRPEWLPNVPVQGVIVDVDKVPDRPIRRDEAVVYTELPLPPQVATGRSVTLDARLGNLPGRIVGVTGGLPQIVKNGKPHVDGADERAAIRTDFLTTSHPRTAIGIRPGGEIVMVTVDGRQPGRSVGIDLFDLAEYMISLGCIDALNCDGGGSTTMVVNGQLANFPSDTSGARTVSTGLFLMRNAPLGRPNSLTILPRDVFLPTGSGLKLNLVAHDASGEMVPWNPQWQVVHRVGEEEYAQHAFTDSLDFRAETPGDKVVNVRLVGTNIHGRAIIRVADAQSVDFQPRNLLLQSGDAAPFRVEATHAEGTPFYAAFQPSGMDVPDFLEHDASRNIIQALAPGVGKIQAQHGDVTITANVAVDTVSKKLVKAFDTPPDGDSTEFLSLINMNTTATRVSHDTEIYQEGNASWALDYSMHRTGGASRVDVPVRVQLPEDALGVGVRVWGDGSGHWLRGELLDANENRFVIDFTTPGEGVSWKGEWRHVWTNFLRLTSIGIVDQPPMPPYTLDKVYLVEPNRSAKGDGMIRLDAVYSLTIPE
ncbi:MAG: phosphodiester glycosidase family protein [Candidatus Sumerlaeia bacterium]|nr:phosphodiester glycosidase family protein [Candidatus Sumerlaeia bacterium]